MTNPTSLRQPKNSAPFAHSAECPWEPTDPGVKRQILAHGPELMLVRVVFEAGAIGPLHQHPHIQNSYIESGRFEITIAGETRELGVGDSFYVPGNVLHGAKALEAGCLIDAFNPMRAEFIRP
ncbi:MAG: cupin domain-containing protein [Rhabdaerophilum sp.]